MKKGISLIGMAGSGKSTVGAALADLLGLELFDLDAHTEAETGIAVGVLIKMLGGEHLVALQERETLAQTLAGRVFSTPGSIIYSDVLAKMRAETTIVMLNAPFATIERRIGGDIGNSRGVVGLGAGGLRALFDARQLVYREWADLIVDADEADNPAGVARRIVAALPPDAGS